jgi:ATP-binding cassette subfamily B protein
VGQVHVLLATYLRPQWQRALLLAFLLVAGIGLQLVNPQVVRYFIDTAQAGGPQTALVKAALVFIVFAMAARGMAFAADYMATATGWTATNALRADLTMHLLNLDLPFHKVHTPGELIERIDGDVSTLANFFSQFTIKVLANGLLAVGILVLLYREDWRVGVGLTAYAVLTLFALGAVQKAAVPRWKAERQTDAELFGFVEERISGAEEIRAAGAEPYAMHGLYRLLRDLLTRTRAAMLVSHVTYVLSNFFFVIGYALGLSLGAYLYGQGQVTIGAAYLIVYYIGMLAGPLNGIREQAEDWQRAAASIGRTSDLFRLQPQVRDNPKSVCLPRPRVAGQTKIALSVTFDDVSFSYGDEEQGNGDNMALRGVSFHLESCRVLGLLGRTGSGKTTISRLLFRLYDPTGGSVRLEGIDLRDLPLADLRRQIGMVTQDVQLFQASVRDNLTFFDRQIGDDQIERILHNLRLWDWVQSLPQGLDTMLAAGAEAGQGRGLSAGEAQLLAFARVFMHNPGVVILDEASSRLDPATETLLERAVDRLLEGRTGIVIAHRLRTIQRADHLLILADGQVVECGPRAQLAADPTSRFYHLLETGLEEALQ